MASSAQPCQAVPSHGKHLNRHHCQAMSSHARQSTHLNRHQILDNAISLPYPILGLKPPNRNKMELNGMSFIIRFGAFYGRFYDPGAGMVKTPLRSQFQAFRKGVTMLWMLWTSAPSCARHVSSNVKQCQAMPGSAKQCQT